MIAEPREDNCLFAEGTIGRSTHINKEEWLNYLYDSHVLLLRVNKEILDPSFFTEFFNSPLGQKQVEYIKSAQSTKQTELGVNNLKKIGIPLPPLEIQQKIASHITSIKEQIQTLRSTEEELRNKAKADFEEKVFQF